ncbi:MAG TPA: sulfotransferase [Sphingomicrobium sp.]|nr:sulfotransferase [Sphingomicrobium sp.]
MTATVPLVLQAIEALKAGERRRAADLLEQELRTGPPPGDRWRSVSMLAAQIGEIETAIEASRRSASPPSLERLLQHWGRLASYGRSAEAIDEIERLAPPMREHSAVLTFRGTIAGEQGRFEEAEQSLRRALDRAPDAPETWFGLSTIKTFEPDDADVRAMESLAVKLNGAPPEAQAKLHYALGKARDDIGDFDRAFDHYRRGAAFRRKGGSYDGRAARIAADRIIRDFTPENMGQLRPSQAGEQRSIFVTGLPRSGTTLVQQMLAAHSRVDEGDEVNLFKPALIPTLDFSFEGAIAYQTRSASHDPWGDVARDYAKFIDMRFRSHGLVVDKSLGQSALIGLLLHSLPEAKIIWLRRSAEDTALSCFRTSFTASTHWSWSIPDIANHFRIEDQLFEHWRSVFGDRILVVPYEGLVREPGEWTGTLATHAELEFEAEMQRFHQVKRTVRTASVKQVRSPVSTARIGAAGRYPRFAEEFRAAYHG